MTELDPVTHRTAPRTIRLVAAALMAALAVAVLLTSPAGARTAASDSQPVGDSVVGRAVAGAGSAASERAWTPARMRASVAAEPGVVPGARAGAPKAVERGAPSVVAPSRPDAVAGSSVTAAVGASAVEGYWSGGNGVAPARQIGKLFFRAWSPQYQKWYDSHCSASIVTAPNQSTVWTAGHCVLQTNTNTWNTNYVFCPGYKNGSCPFGQWKPSWQATTQQWMNAVCQPDLRCQPREFNYDFGVLKMQRNNGHTIQGWNGSHGIRFNGATTQYRYALGYPAARSNAQYLYVCQDTNGVYDGNLWINCTAGPGMSGGPWLSGLSNGFGTVHSVNSHGDGYMGGPYQGAVAQTLYNNNKS